MNVYERFLHMLDFSEEEINELMPHWRNACRKTGLTENDIRYAMEKWIPTYWDLSLHGVRRCIAAYLREFIDVTRLPEYKARGAKLLYYNMPSHPALFYANKISGGDKIHISYPDYFIASVFNAFFHKDVGGRKDESECRSPVCHQCGMNRVKANECFKALVEEPTVLWTWGLYCNEGHKTEELINAMDDREWNSVLCTVPKDAASDIFEADDDRRTAYLAEQFRECQREVSRYTGIEVTDSDAVKAVEQYLDYMSRIDELTELVATADPQPISGNELIIFSIPCQIALNTGLGYLREAIDIMIDEVKERISRGEGPLPADSPRIACHFLPFTVPWVNKAFMDNGINISINTFFAPAYRMKRYFDRDNIYKSIASQWLCNPSTVNMKNEAAYVSEILEKYPQDGALYGFFAFDCWIGLLQKTMIKQVEQESGVPHFYLEGSFWSDEGYSLDDRLTRIQNIAYKLKINHMINGWNNAKK